MEGSCRTCGSDQLIVENHEQVCTNCGDVVEEFAGASRLCAVPDGDAVQDSFRNKKYEANQRLTGRIRNETNCAETRRKIDRDRVVDDMRKIVKQFMKHPAAVDETLDLFKAVAKAHQRRLIANKKLGFVGACIYYVSAKHQLGISLHDICKTTNIKMKVISSSLREVRLLCPEFEYERPNIKDLVKKYVDELANRHYDLNAFESDPTSSAHIEPRPLIDPKDRIVLQNRVMLLIDLFEAMHPYYQPTQQSLVAAVIYHAWKSLDTFKMIAINLSTSIQTLSSIERSLDINDDDKCEHSSVPSDDELQRLENKALMVKHSIRYEKFCQMCKFKYSSSGYKLACKLQSSLLMLGRYLGDVNRINLPWYLKDIIENSAHLLQEHMRTETICEPTETNKDSEEGESLTCTFCNREH